VVLHICCCVVVLGLPHHYFLFHEVLKTERCGRGLYLFRLKLQTLRGLNYLPLRRFALLGHVGGELLDIVIRKAGGDHFR